MQHSNPVNVIIGQIQSQSDRVDDLLPDHDVAVGSVHGGALDAWRIVAEHGEEHRPETNSHRSSNNREESTKQRKGMANTRRLDRARGHAVYSDSLRQRLCRW